MDSLIHCLTVSDLAIVDGGIEIRFRIGLRLSSKSDAGQGGRGTRPALTESLYSKPRKPCLRNQSLDSRDSAGIEVQT